MGIALAGVVMLAPPSRDFYEIVRPPVLFAFLKDRLLPKGQWFGARPADTTAALETGEGAGRRRLKSGRFPETFGRLFRGGGAGLFPRQSFRPQILDPSCQLA